MKDPRERRWVVEEDMAVAREGVADEARWVAEAQGGSVRAFEQLYRLHARHVYALCLRMAGNAAEAEELTQEVFIRAWKKLGSFRSDSAFGTWLHRLAVNVALTRYRNDLRRSAWESSGVDLESTAERAQTQPDPALRIDLDAAIAALPVGARTVFVLHDVEGYRHEEIAQLTGMAVGTSKAHLHRARKLLRETMLR